MCQIIIRYAFLFEQTIHVVLMEIITERDILIFKLEVRVFVLRRVTTMLHALDGLMSLAGASAWAPTIAHCDLIMAA